MRNLKKFLALVLAMMMVFSLMVTVNAATDFADADEVSPVYAEAVEVLAGIGVIEGGSSDKLTPKDTFTRAHLATVAYRVGTGSTADTTEVELFRGRGPFTDVPETNWANPYINFAYNAEWVHGVNEAQTLYNPGGTVTGYQALALLLQILGYGKQGEFLGSGWQIEAARYGKEAGLTAGLVNTTLSSAATREQVFQMMFNALQANPVTYSADAKGYKADEETLGEKYFDLVCDDSIDDWGRPVHLWFKDTNGNGQKEATEKTYATINAAYVAQFHDIRSDCDIYDDKNFSVDEGSIVAYYIDGNEQDDPTDASTSGDGYIDDLDVTDYIGGQGVLTEIYKVEAGYHIVQINTWLAKVTKVTAPYTDKNGHTTKRTIDLEIYTDDVNTPRNNNVTIARGVVSDVYSKDDYVLVYINQPYDDNVDGSFSGTDDNFEDIVLVGTASVIGSGSLTSWSSRSGATFSTSTVGGKKLDESEKFVLNYHQTNGNWAALGDQYGYLIGLGVTPDNYVLIEAISWIHNGVRDGYAAADLITADGESLTGVTVAKIGTETAQTAKNDNDGIVTDADALQGRVADNWTHNTVYYNHLYTYSVDENGAYTLTKHSVPSDNIVDVDTTTGVITNGSPAILDSATRVAVATDYTVFMVYNNNTGTYTKYVGKNDVPDIVSAKLCILNKDGYAVLVIVNGNAATNTDVYFVGSLEFAGSVTTSGTTHYGYWVYKLGETEPEMLYVDNSFWTAVGGNDWDTKVPATGLYEITTLANGRIVDATLLAADSDRGEALSGSSGSNNFYTMVAGASSTGTSIYTSQWTSGDISNATYTTYALAFNTGSAKVIEVTKVDASASADVLGMRDDIEMTDIAKNDVIIVVYNSRFNASYIYVIREQVTGTGSGSTTATGKLTLDVTGVTATATYTSATSETSGNVYVRIRYRVKGTETWSWANTTTTVTVGAGDTGYAAGTATMNAIIISGEKSTYEVQAVVVSSATNNTVLDVSNIEYYNS